MSITYADGGKLSFPYRNSWSDYDDSWRYVGYWTKSGSWYNLDVDLKNKRGRSYLTNTSSAGRTYYSYISTSDTHPVNGATYNLY